MRVVIILVALAVILATVYAVGYYVPTQVAVLSQGRFHLPVPLTLLSTAPNVTWATIDSRALVHFTSTPTSGAEAFQFDWGLAGPATLPVVFAMDIPDSQSSYYVGGTGGSFHYRPAGGCGGTCTSTSYQIGAMRPGISFAVGAVWVFNYTVRLMSRLEGFASTRFLEVDLSPSGLETPGTSYPADLGVPSATAEDLQLVQSFNAQSGSTFGFSTNASEFQSGSFGFSPAPVTLDAGSQGNVSIRLSSHIHWDPLTWEAVSFSGSGGNFSVQEFVDVRFGSILLQVGPWTVV